MTAHGEIFSGLVVYGSDPESVGPFTNSFILYRALIWGQTVSIFQVSDA